jgi:hypothetical protein
VAFRYQPFAILRAAAQGAIPDNRGSVTRAIPPPLDPNESVEVLGSDWGTRVEPQIVCPRAEGQRFDRPKNFLQM